MREEPDKTEGRLVMALFKKELSKEEVLKLAEENQLSAEDLDAVSGGYIHWAFNEWQIINDVTGEMMDTVRPASYDQTNIQAARITARRKAIELGQSSDIISYEDLYNLKHGG